MNDGLPGDDVSIADAMMCLVVAPMLRLHIEKCDEIIKAGERLVSLVEDCRKNRETMVRILETL